MLWLMALDAATPARVLDALWLRHRFGLVLPLWVYTRVLLAGGATYVLALALLFSRQLRSVVVRLHALAARAPGAGVPPAP